MSDDVILINDLLVRGILGVNDWERKEKQDIILNLALFADVRACSARDDLAASVDYRAVTKQVIELVESSSRQTAEALATDVARLCLRWPGVTRVRVRVEKPGAVRFARSVGVEIERRPADFA